MTTESNTDRPVIAADSLTTAQAKRLAYVVAFTPGRTASKGVQTAATAVAFRQWEDYHRARYGVDPTPEQIAGRKAADLVHWGMPILALGKPGTGKTQVMESYGGALGFRANTIIASQNQPEDVGGFPVPDHDAGIIRRMPDGWVDHVNTAANGAVQIFDELTTCGVDMEAAILRVFSDHAAGPLALSNRVRLIALGNNVGEGPNVRELSTAAANRFVHINWSGASVEEWVQYMLGGADGGEPIDPNEVEAKVLAQWPAAISSAMTMVSEYITKHPSYLHDQPEPDHPAASRGWASHRTWEMVAIALAGCTVHGLGANAADMAVRHAWIAGLVGPGHADEFLTWLDAQDLPDPQAVMEASTPEAAIAAFGKLDRKRPDRIMVTINACAALYVRRVTDLDANPTMAAKWQANLVAVLEYVAAQHAEVAMFAVRILFSGGKIDPLKATWVHKVTAGNVGKVAIGEHKAHQAAQEAQKRRKAK